MQFRKLSEEELKQADVTSFRDPGNLENGEAEFVIYKSIDHVTNSGKSCLKWMIDITQGDKSGKCERLMWMPQKKYMWIWSYCLKSMGYPGAEKFWERYNGNIEASIFDGKGGKCVIKKEVNEYEKDGKLISNQVIEIESFTPMGKVIYEIKPESKSKKEKIKTTVEDDDIPF